MELYLITIQLVTPVRGVSTVTALQYAETLASCAILAENWAEQRPHLRLAGVELRDESSDLRDAGHGAVLGLYSLDSHLLGLATAK